MRRAEIRRETGETSIALRMDLDGAGRGEIDSGIGFFDHLLTLLCHHARIDLGLTCRGDTRVDGHHSVEDIGIALGKALKEALGDKKGVARYGQCLLPMDEALMLCAVDFSGRGGYYGDLSIPSWRVGEFETELLAEFFEALAREAGLTLHIRQLGGKNSHHIMEGAVKAFARALKEAVAQDSALLGRVNSSKGSL